MCLTDFSSLSRYSSLDGGDIVNVKCSLVENVKISRGLRISMSRRFVKEYSLLK